MMKKIYAGLAVLGIILPYSQFVPWTMGNGSSLVAMGQAMFANQIAAGIALDALLAAVVLIVFIVIDSRKLKVQKIWLPIMGVFVFGLAFAFPCYLYLREGGKR